MNLIKRIKAVLVNKIKPHTPAYNFALYCKNNPSASACKIYDL